MRFQTSIDLETFTLIYALFQNQSGYSAESASDTSRTTAVINRRANLQPDSLAATLFIRTEIADADGTMIDEQVNAFPLMFSQSKTDEVMVESETYSGDPIRTGTTSSHVERIVEMTAFTNEHELEIEFDRLGAYMGQTLDVTHHVGIVFGADARDTATGYLGTIPSDSLMQSGRWLIRMRETGYGSALNESEAAWVADNVTP